MRKKIFRIGIAAAMLAVVGWFSWQYLKREPPARAPQSVSYMNMVYGYEIYYPDSFTLVDEKNISEFRDAAASVLEERDITSGEALLVEKNVEHIPIVYAILAPSAVEGAPDAFGKYVEMLRENLRKRARKYKTLFRERELTFGKSAVFGREFSFDAEIPHDQDGRFGAFSYLVFEHDDAYFLFRFHYPKEIDGLKYREIYNDILASFLFFEE